jgi:hypothetical protein
MQNKLTQAYNRPMSSKEQFGLVLFVLKFILSKFGIFIIFLSFNLGSFTQKGLFEHKTLPTQPNSLESQTIEGQKKPRKDFDFLSSSELFSKLKMYCIIATIVTLFLTPQQTKYFGGLAVVLKQAGFFSKYGKSEKTVYILSWIVIALFAQLSYQTSHSLVVKIANPGPLALG